MLLLCVNENIIKIMFRMMISKYWQVTLLERPSGGGPPGGLGRVLGGKEKIFFGSKGFDYCPWINYFHFRVKKDDVPGKQKNDFIEAL